MATLILGQDALPHIYQNVQYNGYYGVNIPPPPTRCGGGCWFPTASIAPPFGPTPYRQADSVVKAMTGYVGDGTGQNCFGIAGNLIYQMNAIQGGPKTVGIVLSPRAISTKGFNYAILMNHWFCAPQYRPWSSHNGFQMQADMCLPFVYVPNVAGDLQIASQGQVDVYFVAQFGNIKYTNQFISFCPRVLQNQYPQGADASNNNSHVFGPGNQIWFDQTNAPLLFPELKSGAWITSVGNATFNVGAAGDVNGGHNSNVRTYGFSINSSQFTTAVNAINAATWLPQRGYDPTPANWQLRIVNINMEAWGTNPASDARLGLNISNFLVWVL